MNDNPNRDGSAGQTSAVRRKALLVDDSVSSILLLQDMLKAHCDCFAATNGTQAIALFEKAIQEEKPFDIVLLDIEMPGMNGLDVLKELRALEMACKKKISLFGLSIPKGKKYSSIIMQTASDNPAHLLDAYMNGRCNGYVNKPFNKKELIEKIFLGL